MTPYPTMLRAAVCSAALFAISSAGFAQTTDQPAPPAPGTATHIMGFADVKRDAKGKISVDDKSLKFGKAAIELSSVQDVFTGAQGRQTGGTAFKVAKMAVPYGGGRVLSLLARETVDTLTIDYTDANSGAHSAIFMLPKGQAESIKKQMVDHGAKATAVAKEEPAKSEASKEKK
jgi:hypothetical protein